MNDELMQVAQTLSSLIVAEMAEKTHKNLLRDIKRYTEQMEEANEHEKMGQLKIEPSDFWSESSYTNEQGKTQPCYEITRNGCEFIAHKMTGTKGTAFTARYILKFRDLQQIAVEQRTSPLQTIKTESSYILPPKGKTWFEMVNNDMKRVIAAYHMTRTELYHEILKECGKRYNFPEAEKQYRRENGFAPEYALDVVAYFPQLREVAENYLNYMINSNPFC